MANFRRYFFVMPTLARIEREMHERVARGEGLTAEVLGSDRMADLFARRLRPGRRVRPRASGDHLGRVPHLYEPFYVFQYATGISGAHALARGSARRRGGRRGALPRLPRAPAAPQYPLDALRAAGVDLASPEPVEETFAVLSSFVDRLEELV